MPFFMGPEKKSWNSYGNTKDQKELAEGTLSKKNTTGGIAIPDLKVYYRAIVTRTDWCWRKKQTRKPLGHDWKIQK